jgi:lipoprotein signal peptidase
MVHTFGGRYAGFLSLMQWLVVTVIVAWLVRHRAPWQILLIAVAMIVLVTAVAHGLALALGYEFELDSI